MRHLKKLTIATLLTTTLTGCYNSAPGWTKTGPDPKNSASSTPDRLSWGPSQKNLDDAKQIVTKMTPEQKAGQVIIGFYEGTDTTPIVSQVKDLHLGGAIFMGDNIVTNDDGTLNAQGTADAVKAINAAAVADGRSYGAMIGTDQEGGDVARITAPATLWPNAMAYGASQNPDIAKKANTGIATETGALGFNIDFAPDADLTIGANDPAINVRSMSSDATLGSKMVPAAMQGILDGGVLPSVKHFPGHGSVTTDSHTSLPVQNASIDDLKKRDWVPFQSAIQAGVPMIMMGHIDVPALENGVPSSLSAPAYKALRGLGFQGVITTDALNMEGITNEYDSSASAVKALNAGADILLMPPDASQAHQAIIDALNNGQLSKDRLDDAATKVVTMMLWQKERQKPVNPGLIGSQAATAKQVSAAGLTVAAGKCQADALPDKQVQIIGGSDEDQAAATASAQAAGLTVGDTGPVVALDSGSGGVSGDIVVSTDTPWYLGTTDQGDTKIAIYGNNPGAFDSLFDYLTGKTKASGVLPAPVDGIDAAARCTP
ncbi:MAG: glycoside hydrolase family 3 N-terminal domain-containing protein [Micrococcaceae bacterium]